MVHYDMLVIGSGPAGQKAAIQAAKIGKKVGIIERREVVGGICINTGTIPSKSLHEAVLFLSGFRQRNLYGAGFRVKANITLEDLSFRCQHVMKAEQEIIQNQLVRNQVDFINGTASFIDPHCLSIQYGTTITQHTADNVVVAVGTEPAHPPDGPFDGETVIDSDSLLTLKRLPKSLTIVGGGVIGCEYACILATLGIPVVLVERRPRLLEFVDTEIIEALQYQMRSIGITLRFNEEVVGIEKPSGDAVTIRLKSGKQITASLLLYSIGRIGATKQFGLANIGIQPDERGRLKVNENFQTALPHIYAAGDVDTFITLWDLQHPGNFFCGSQRGGTNGRGYSLRSRYRPLSRDRPRPAHRGYRRNAQAAVSQRNQGTARGSRHRRGRNRAHSYRTSGDGFGWEVRLLYRQRLQLSNVGRMLQSRRLSRPQSFSPKESPGNHHH